MAELTPWAWGALVGMAYPRPLSLARGAVFAALIIALGLSVAILDGEWSENPGYALIDIGQTWLAASITMFARRHFASRAPRQPAGTAQR